jgi:tellurite resistance protein
MLVPRVLANSIRIQLLARAARSAVSSGGGIGPSAAPSILSLAAASYGVRPREDTTIPTGFDPAAVALFEAIIEGSYLVANADGTFDDDERRAFERIVVEACGGAVSSQQISMLVSDLQKQLRADGLERRVDRLAAGLVKKEHAREVLRVAAIVAQVSEGVSDVERTVLSRLAEKCGLDGSEVDTALAEAKSALAG